MVHEERIIHRDIKPDNFIITDDSKVYLIDFGLSKHHVDWQYQNISIDVIKKSHSIEEVFNKIRQNGIEIRKCLFCDDNLKNI